MNTILEGNQITMTREQIEIILHKKFINNLHWDVFRNNFLYHFIFKSKKDIFEYFTWSILEYRNIKNSTRNI